jgi:hypothetical protein
MSGDHQATAVPKNDLWYCRHHRTPASPPPGLAPSATHDAPEASVRAYWMTTPATQLWLYGNQLSSIEPNAFTGLANLTSLDLEGNWLSTIEMGAFSGLPGLTYLSLRDNQLSSIESGAFSGLTNLTTLRLTNIQVSSIELGAFGGLVSLTELSLSLAGDAALTKLNLESADFPSLLYFHVAGNATVGGK